jgi:hypothetical protein
MALLGWIPIMSKTHNSRKLGQLIISSLLDKCTRVEFSGVDIIINDCRAAAAAAAI